MKIGHIAPFYFNKLMKKVFGGYQSKIAITYFDDIFLIARFSSELMEKLRKVLELLRASG